MLLTSWLRGFWRSGTPTAGGPLTRGTTAVAPSAVGPRRRPVRLRVTRLEPRRVLNAGPIAPPTDLDGGADDPAGTVSVDDLGGITVDAGHAANDGTADQFHIYRHGDDLAVSVNGHDVFHTAFGELRNLTIQGSDDADALTVDLGDGDRGAGAIRFDGGGGTDSLMLHGTADRVTHTLDGDGAGTVWAGSGADPAATVLRYESVERAADAIAAELRAVRFSGGGAATLSAADGAWQLDTADTRFEFAAPDERFTLDLTGGDGTALTITDVDSNAGPDVVIQGDGGDHLIFTGQENFGGGSLFASAGHLDVTGSLHADAIRLHGVGEIDAAGSDASGPDANSAGANVSLHAGARIEAAGGLVELDAGDTGTLTVAGTIDVTPLTDGQGDTNGQGGTVRLLGREVRLTDGAVVDASGPGGGGVILVGGDFRGENPLIHNAAQVTIADGVRLEAGAGETGDGGRVVVWSDGTTAFAGAIVARGGGTGGDGGFVEVSGKGVLDFRGTVDVSAPAGRDGTLLLDPRSIVVRATLPDINGDGVPGDDIQTRNDLDSAGRDFPGADSFITAAALQALLTGGGVVALRADAFIRFEADVTAAPNFTGQLRLSAGTQTAGSLAVTARRTVDLLGGGLVIERGITTGTFRSALRTIEISLPAAGGASGVDLVLGRGANAASTADDRVRVLVGGRLQADTAAVGLAGVVVNGSGAADIVRLTGNLPGLRTNVTVNTFAGEDRVFLDNLTTLGVVKVDAGAGNDAVQVGRPSSGQTTPGVQGANLVIDGGTGDDRILFENARTVGTVTVTGGTGDDLVRVDGVSSSVRGSGLLATGAVRFGTLPAAGNAGSDVERINIVGTVSATGGAGITLAASRNVSIGGSVNNDDGTISELAGLVVTENGLIRISGNRQGFVSPAASETTGDFDVVNVFRLGRVESVGGSILIAGQSGDTDGSRPGSVAGIRIEGTVQTTGPAAEIRMTGNARLAAGGAIGIAIVGPDAVVSAAGVGRIALTGTAVGTLNRTGGEAASGTIGVVIADGGRVTAGRGPGDAATVTITGTAQTPVAAGVPDRPFGVGVLIVGASGPATVQASGADANGQIGSVEIRGFGGTNQNAGQAGVLIAGTGELAGTQVLATTGTVTITADVGDLVMEANARVATIGRAAGPNAADPNMTDSALGAGDVTLTSARDVQIDRVEALLRADPTPAFRGNVTVEAAGAILNARTDGQRNVVASTLTLRATAGIGADEAIVTNVLRVDARNTANAAHPTGGDINIMQVRGPVSAGSTTVGGPIGVIALEQLGPGNTGSITLIAAQGGIEVLAPGGADGPRGVLIAGTTGTVRLEARRDADVVLRVSHRIAATEGVHLVSDGQIIGTAPDDSVQSANLAYVRSLSVALNAGTGIGDGEANPLNLRAGTVAAMAGGNIALRQQAAGSGLTIGTAGGLTGIMIRPMTTGEIRVETETDVLMTTGEIRVETETDVLIVNQAVTALGLAGDVVLRAGVDPAATSTAFLQLDAPVIAGRDVVLTGEGNLRVNATVTAAAAGADVLLGSDAAGVTIAANVTAGPTRVPGGTVNGRVWIGAEGVVEQTAGARVITGELGVLAGRNIQLASAANTVDEFFAGSQSGVAFVGAGSYQVGGRVSGGLAASNVAGVTLSSLVPSRLVVLINSSGDLAGLLAGNNVELAATRGGSILLAGPVSAIDVTGVRHDVRIDAGSSVLLPNGTRVLGSIVALPDGLIIADTLGLRVAGLAAVQTDVNTLAATAGVSGELIVREANAVTIGSIAARGVFATPVAGLTAASVRLQAGGAVTQSVGADVRAGLLLGVQAGELEDVQAGGDVLLTNAGNAVRLFAAESSGVIALRVVGDVTIGVAAAATPVPLPDGRTGAADLFARAVGLRAVGPTGATPGNDIHNDIHLRAGGAIAASPNITVTAARLALEAGRGIGAENAPILTRVQTVAAASGRADVPATGGIPDDSIFLREVANRTAADSALVIGTARNLIDGAGGSDIAGVRAAVGRADTLPGTSIVSVSVANGALTVNAGVSGRNVALNAGALSTAGGDDLLALNAGVGAVGTAHLRASGSIVAAATGFIAGDAVALEAGGLLIGRPDAPIFLQAGTVAAASGQAPGVAAASGQAPGATNGGVVLQQLAVAGDLKVGRIVRLIGDGQVVGIASGRGFLPASDDNSASAPVAGKATVLVDGENARLTVAERIRVQRVGNLGGNLLLQADQMTIDADLIAQNAAISLTPRTDGRGITLGGEVAGTLGLTSADLSHVVADSLTIGGRNVDGRTPASFDADADAAATAGTITVIADVSTARVPVAGEPPLAPLGTVALLTGGEIRGGLLPGGGGGTLDVGGAKLVLDAQGTIGGVSGALDDALAVRARFLSGQVRGAGDFRVTAAAIGIGGPMTERNSVDGDDWVAEPGITTTTGAIFVAARAGRLAVNAPLIAGGDAATANLTLRSAGDVELTAGPVRAGTGGAGGGLLRIDADGSILRGLDVVAEAGSVRLTAGVDGRIGATDAVPQNGGLPSPFLIEADLVAAQAGSNLIVQRIFRSGGALTVGTVDGLEGVTSDTGTVQVLTAVGPLTVAGPVTAGVDVALRSLMGNLTIDGPVTAANSITATASVSSDSAGFPGAIAVTGSLTATAGDVLVTAGAGRLTTAGPITAGNDVTLVSRLLDGDSTFPAGLLIGGTVTAGNDVTASARLVRGAGLPGTEGGGLGVRGAIHAGQDVKLTASGLLSVEAEVSAGRDIAATGVQTLTVDGPLAAGVNLTLRSNRGDLLLLADVTAGTDGVAGGTGVAGFDAPNGAILQGRPDAPSVAVIAPSAVFTAAGEIGHEDRPIHLRVGVVAAASRDGSIELVQDAPPDAAAGRPLTIGTLSSPPADANQDGIIDPAVPIRGLTATGPIGVTVLPGNAITTGSDIGPLNLALDVVAPVASAGGNVTERLKTIEITNPNTQVKTFVEVSALSQQVTFHTFGKDVRLRALVSAGYNPFNAGDQEILDQVAAGELVRVRTGGDIEYRFTQFATAARDTQILIDTSLDPAAGDGTGRVHLTPGQGMLRTRFGQVVGDRPNLSQAIDANGNFINGVVDDTLLLQFTVTAGNRVQIVPVDANGNPAVDANGNPVVNRPTDLGLRLRVDFQQTEDFVSTDPRFQYYIDYGDGKNFRAVAPFAEAAATAAAQTMTVTGPGGMGPESMDSSMVTLGDRGESQELPNGSPFEGTFSFLFDRAFITGQVDPETGGSIRIPVVASQDPSILILGQSIEGTLDPTDTDPLFLPFPGAPGFGAVFENQVLPIQVTPLSDVAVELPIITGAAPQVLESRPPAAPQAPNVPFFPQDQLFESSAAVAGAVASDRPRLFLVWRPPGDEGVVGELELDFFWYEREAQRALVSAANEGWHWFEIKEPSTPSRPLGEAFYVRGGRVVESRPAEQLASETEAAAEAEDAGEAPAAGPAGEVPAGDGGQNEGETGNGVTGEAGDEALIGEEPAGEERVETAGAAMGLISAGGLLGTGGLLNTEGRWRRRLTAAAGMNGMAAATPVEPVRSGQLDRAARRMRRMRRAGV